MAEDKKVYNIKADKIFDPSVPTRQELRNNNFPWVWAGYDNIYPDFITELFNKSAFNRTCLISKANAVMGNGLKTDDPNEEYRLENINPEQSWNDVFERCVLDYEVQGAFAVQIVWDRLGENIAAIYHIDVTKIRSGFIDPATDKVEWYYLSYDWAKYKKAEFKPRAFKAFSPEHAKEYPTQILYYWDYYPGAQYYGAPSYSGALTAISSDCEVDSFHLSNLKNGLTPSLWINMNGGDPGPEARQQIYSEIASSWGGTSNSGKFMLSFSSGKDQETTITPIEGANDDYYLALQERLITTIMSGHRITNPKMLGVYESSSGVQVGGRDQILDSYQLFTQMVVVPDTKSLLKPFNRLFELFGGVGKLFVEPLKLFPEIVGGEVKEGGKDVQIVEEMA